MLYREAEAALTHQRAIPLVELACLVGLGIVVWLSPLAPVGIVLLILLTVRSVERKRR